MESKEPLCEDKDEPKKIEENVQTSQWTRCAKFWNRWRFHLEKKVLVKLQPSDTSTVMTPSIRFPNGLKRLFENSNFMNSQSTMEAMII